MTIFGDPWPRYELRPDWYRQPRWYYQPTKTVTTNHTMPELVVDEECVRRIVREEIADIMPIDVPDAPPEDLA